MSTAGAVFRHGHLIARNRASEAGSARRSPSLPSPPTGSYTTSSFGRAEPPQAVLLTICFLVCGVTCAALQRRSSYAAFNIVIAFCQT